MMQTTTIRKSTPQQREDETKNIAVMLQQDGSRVHVEHDGSDFAKQMIEEQNNCFRRGMALIESGKPALYRLMEIAERRDGTGQARYIARFLLGLYNGPEHPFDLTDLRALDIPLQDDCRAVLEMDMKACYKEVHRYFNNGGERFAALAKDYGLTS